MDQDDGLSPAELGPHGLKVCVPEVVVIASVPGEQDDAVGGQLIQSI